MERIKALPVSDFLITRAEDPVQRQKALAEIWQIVVSLGEGSEVTLRVPSECLINRGLVTGATEEDIKQTAQHSSSAPENRISFVVGGDRALIKKTFLSKRTVEGGVREDTIREEIAILQKDSQSQTFRMELSSKAVDSHLHFRGKTWFSQEDEGGDFSGVFEEATFQDINRTLVLLREGLPKLFK